jgi:hypothetical protein
MFASMWGAVLHAVGNGLIVHLFTASFDKALILQSTQFVADSQCFTSLI